MEGSDGAALGFEVVVRNESPTDSVLIESYGEPLRMALAVYAKGRVYADDHFVSTGVEHLPAFYVALRPGETGRAFRALDTVGVLSLESDRLEECYVTMVSGMTVVGERSVGEQAWRPLLRKVEFKSGNKENGDPRRIMLTRNALEINTDRIYRSLNRK
jgi:hypothetical protein